MTCVNGLFQISFPSPITSDTFSDLKAENLSAIRDIIHIEMKTKVGRLLKRLSVIPTKALVYENNSMETDRWLLAVLPIT